MSSTLQELADERRAARAAIERLRLAPVMFELGARPHPPRDLYRAYLDQSDVFVGIYWQRYGWVAPGETVSGLEDEYLLSGIRPKPIYVKAPAPEREARLEQLLPAGPELVRLLAAAPGVKLLVTSRSRLDLSAERVRAVPPLGLPSGDARDERSEAVTLLLQRARALRP